MKKEEGIKIAICICMYSETKTMLKKTLAGVAQNIANLVAYERVDPDDIGVFVMMDGIEKVDKIKATNKTTNSTYKQNDNYTLSTTHFYNNIPINSNNAFHFYISYTCINLCVNFILDSSGPL